MKCISGLKKSALSQVAFLIHQVSQQESQWGQGFGGEVENAGGEEGRKADSTSDKHGRPRKETQESKRGGRAPQGGGTLE